MTPLQRIRPVLQSLRLSTETLRLLLLYSVLHRALRQIG